MVLRDAGLQRTRQQHQPTDQLAILGCRLDGDHGAKRMADENRPFEPQPRDQPGNVVGEVRRPESARSGL